MTHQVNGSSNSNFRYFNPFLEETFPDAARGSLFGRDTIEVNCNTNTPSSASKASAKGGGLCGAICCGIGALCCCVGNWVTGTVSCFLGALSCLFCKNK